MEVASEEFTAVPQSGHYFAGWQAAECAGVDAVCTLKISSALTGATETAYTLKAVLKPIAASAAATYTHNVLGQRTSKTVGGVTTFFIYDTAGNLIQELDSAGKPVVEMVYLEDQAVARIEKSGTTTATRYVHNDHLGAPVMMTNQERKVTWEIETSPFGEPYALYEAGIAQNSRFPGQYFDSETGLHYNYFRNYDPAIGRYLQSDPIGLAGGFNTYAYVGGNPLKYVDPLGLDATLLTGGGYGDHSYGHVALRVHGNGYDKVYDFGRYGKTWGLGGSEGEGQLRVWSDFDKYIAGENATGRTTTGFTYSTTEAQDQAMIAYYAALIANTKAHRSRGDFMNQYKIADYHAANNNCTTVSLDGLSQGISPGLYSALNDSKYAKGRGLGLAERLALKAAQERAIVKSGVWPFRLRPVFDLVGQVRHP